MKLVKFTDIETDLIMYVNPLHITIIRQTAGPEYIQHDHYTNVYVRENVEPIKLNVPTDYVAEYINDALPRYRYED
jgi:hypothetical protein